MAARSKGDLHIKPFLGELRAWKAAARREGETLTAWIRARLNATVAPEPMEPTPPRLPKEYVKMPEGPRNAAETRFDEDLTVCYFDEQIAPGLRASGMPVEGVGHLRDNYVTGVTTNVEAQQQIREHYAQLYWGICAEDS